MEHRVGKGGGGGRYWRWRVGGGAQVANRARHEWWSAGDRLSEIGHSSREQQTFLQLWGVTKRRDG